jgi:hypothetical protein
LARAYTSEEINSLKRDFGQVKDLARSAYGLVAEVLELHGRGFGPVAIARQLQVSKKSVARVIARWQLSLDQTGAGSMAQTRSSHS